MIAYASVVLAVPVPQAC